MSGPVLPTHWKERTIRRKRKRRARMPGSKHTPDETVTIAEEIITGTNKK